MIARGVPPDEVTYNSLIAHCARSMKPDVARALAVLAEMDALGVPVTDVTLSALAQVFGRAI